MSEPLEDLNDDVRYPARRKAVIFLIISFSLFALIFAAVEIENWRGKSAWKKYQRETEAKGEKLHLQAYVPPPVPKESNFASVPIFAKLFDYRRDSSGKPIWSDTNAMNENSLSVYGDDNDIDSPNLGLWIIGRKTDLGEWRDYYRKSGLSINRNEDSLRPTNDTVGVVNQPETSAIDVLSSLSRANNTLRLLQEASERPFSRLPIHYDEGYRSLVPHLSKLKSASQNLSLRASAHLELEQAEPAAQDVVLSLRLANLSRDEPFLISHLLRTATTTISLHPLWEGLLERRWSDHHLQAFQIELGKFDFLQSYYLAIRGERTFSNLMLDVMRTNRSASTEIIYMEDTEVPFSFDFDSLKFYSCAKFKAAVYRMIPSGWFYQNQVALSRSMQRMLTVIDPVARVVSAQRAKEIASSIGEDGGFYPYRAWADLLLPAFLPSSSKMALRRPPLIKQCLPARSNAIDLRTEFFPKHSPNSHQSLSSKFLTTS